MQAKNKWNCRARPHYKTQDWLGKQNYAHWRKRKIKESLFIGCLNPEKDITSKSIMNLEKGREISDCWKEFNPEIRKIFSKKILGKLALVFALEKGITECRKFE